jgi:hypothetical protein
MTIGGVVRLVEPDDKLIVGEGLLTCLAAMQDGREAAWAALSEGGLVELDLPRQPCDVLVLTDSADVRSNRQARITASCAAAQAAAWRWTWQGYRVRLLAPLRVMGSCGCPHPVTDQR